MPVQVAKDIETSMQLSLNANAMLPFVLSCPSNCTLQTTVQDASDDRLSMFPSSEFEQSELISRTSPK